LNCCEYISEVAACAACDAVKQVKLGELSSLADVDSYVKDAVAKFIDKQGPYIAEKMAAVIQPAAEKAVNIVKPSVMEALKEYTPTFALITGAVLGGAVLLGSWTAARSARKALKR